MKVETLEAILSAREARDARVRIVWLDDGRELLVSNPNEISEDPAVAAAVADTLAGDRGRLVESEAGAAFVHPFSPRIRLVIVGAVHIAQRLAALARDLGYEVTIVDPRRGFLTEARFPGMTLSHEWPDAALEAHGLDERCAVVTLSHDPKIDNPALEVALRSSCFYIGALGSQRTQAKRRDRLRDLGFDDAALARIHGPIGLDIGARSPAEIAVSIAAELTACLRKRA